MTGRVLESPAAELSRKESRGAWALRDALSVAGRNLIVLRRVPQLLIFSTVQPVIFVLLFRYVFGGAISTPGVPYVDFLMPGIFVTTAVFGAIGSAIGMATDVGTGLLERFRSLPMARSAVLAGRTLSDFARNCFVAGLMSAVGFAVGFRIHNGVFPFIAGLGLLLAFGYALSWVFATVGLAFGDPETAQAASFPVVAPLVFASSSFVPVESMPAWLQGFASHQPVSVTVSAIRGLVLGGPVMAEVLQSVAWIVGILLVFVPLAVGRYRRAV